MYHIERPQQHVLTEQGRPVISSWFGIVIGTSDRRARDKSARQRAFCTSASCLSCIFTRTSNESYSKTHQRGPANWRLERNRNCEHTGKPACWKSSRHIASCCCIERKWESDGKAGICPSQRRGFQESASAKFTLEHTCSVEMFLSLLANNDHFKDTIVTHFSKLETILADPECDFIGQLRINFDFGLLAICPKPH